MKFVSVVVGRDNVQQQNVFRFSVQPGDSELHLWKHLPVEHTNWLPSHTHSCLQLDRYSTHSDSSVA